MRIIDRYLLRQFLQTFLICFLSLTGIYVVFDAFTNLEAFLRFARGSQLFKVIGTFYAFQSIYFFDRISSLLVLMSAMFTVAWIQRHNEMTALMAAGVSRIRIVAPVIVAAAAIAVLSAANRELLIPRCKDELAMRPADLHGHSGQELYPQYDNETDVLIRGKLVFPNELRIEKPDFLMPPALGDYGKQWTAENACYQPPAAGRPGGYLLTDIREPKNVQNKPSLSLDGKPVILTPRDRPDWLKPSQAFIVSNVTFDQLNGGQTFRSFASTVEMIRALRNRSLDFGADIRVAIHSRIVQPLLDITLLFLGLPLVVSRESRNVFVAIGLCMGVVTLFLSLQIGFQQLGASSLMDPALAAWAPLILFVPAAVAMSHSMWQR